VHRMPRRFRRATEPLFAIVLLGLSRSLLAADAPTPKLAFSFQPVQKDVVYDTPKSVDYGKCKVDVERRGKASGWVVFGPEGQVLRRFVDTNGDNVVDQWRYYHHGLEVYRDIDTNFNNKVDQSRWLNTAGTRWGVDRDEDGRIDEWNVISAEEASREAVKALTAGNAPALQKLLVTEAELEKLGVKDDLKKKILDEVASPAAKLRGLLGEKTGVTSKSKWVRFNATTPGIIPSDAGKADRDLTVYQNAMAIVETDGKSGLVQIGEMVLVGNTWKLTQIPKPVGENLQISAAGHLMQPAVASTGATPSNTGGISPAMQKLLSQLQELDRNAPQPDAGTKAFVRYNSRRAEIIRKLIDAAPTESDRNQWRRQLVDGVAAAVQSGQYPQGMQTLKTIESEIRRDSPKSEMLPYVTFRRLLAEYTVKLQSAAAGERPEIQKWWLKELQSFAADHPDAEDAPEAMLQLAITLEFSGERKEARQWYAKAVSADRKSPAGIRAAGALRRLDVIGKPLELSGPSLTGGTLDVGDYRGKVTLVVYWATWCKPCTEDLPQLIALYRKHRSDGFEVVGVNVDVNAKPTKPYITRHGIPWKHIHQEGGLDSPPALKYGIISLPTMFLLDRNGKVVSRSTSVDDLKKSLPALLKSR